MNDYNQTDLNNRDINNSNQINTNKSEKFQNAVNNMRLMIWNRFLMGVASNPQMTKKEVCHQSGLKVATINSIQQYYKLSGPFYFKKRKAHKKKGSQTQKEKTEESFESLVK
jgi:predicted acylesterase/phospholipase RssA